MKLIKISIICIVYIFCFFGVSAQFSRNGKSTNQQIEKLRSDSLKLAALFQLLDRQLNRPTISATTRDSSAKEILLATKLNGQLKSANCAGLIALAKAESCTNDDSVRLYAKLAITQLTKTHDYGKLADAYRTYSEAVSYDQYQLKTSTIKKAEYYYQITGNAKGTAKAGFSYSYNQYVRQMYLTDNLRAKKLRLLITGKEDKGQAMLLLKIAHYQIKKPMELKADLDSARSLINMAEKIEDHLKDPECEAAIAIARADIYDEFGDMTAQVTEIGKGIQKVTSIGADDKALGDLYQRLSQAYSMDTKNDALTVNAAHTAIRYYETSGREKNMGDAFYALGRFYDDRSNFDLAQLQFVQALKLYRSAHYTDLFMIYRWLGESAEKRDDIAGADSLFLKAENNITTQTSYEDQFYCAKRLMINYLRSDMYAQSLNWEKRYSDVALKAHKFDAYYYGIEFMVAIMTKLHRPQSALMQLKKALKEHPPLNLVQQRDADDAYARCLVGLHQYEQAEKYMVRYESSLKFYDIEYTPGTDGYYRNYLVCIANLIEFYTDIGKPLVADRFIKEFESINKYPESLEPFNMRLIKFRVDTALKQYKSAFQDYRLADEARSAVMSDSKRRQIEELNISSATEARIKDIKLLENRNEIQQAQLAHINLQKNVVIAGIVVMFVVSLFLYYQYLAKQRINKSLEITQRTINAQHKALRNLVSEKDDLLSDKEELLSDKELLLTEIQHRVKNNLHMISSLLESQSAFLKDEALVAIQTSQHRIQAISLVHQKLYASNDVLEVPMDVYLRQLISYLREHLISDLNIVFQIDVDPIMLSGTQAVPVGLIVNEIITNAMKHAFTDGRLGHIDIFLKWQGDNYILFTISHDGDGSTGGYAVDSNSGATDLTLIRSLAQSIAGAVEWKIEKGNTIKFRFKKT